MKIQEGVRAHFRQSWAKSDHRKPKHYQQASYGRRKSSTPLPPLRGGWIVLWFPAHIQTPELQEPDAGPPYITGQTRRIWIIYRGGYTNSWFLWGIYYRIVSTKCLKSSIQNWVEALGNYSLPSPWTKSTKFVQLGLQDTELWAKTPGGRQQKRRKPILQGI